MGSVVLADHAWNLAADNSIMSWTCTVCKVRKAYSRFLPFSNKVCSECERKSKAPLVIVASGQKRNTQIKELRQRKHEECMERVRSIDGTATELCAAESYVRMLISGNRGYFMATNMFTNEECQQLKQTSFYNSDGRVDIRFGNDGRMQLVLGKQNLIKEHNEHEVCELAKLPHFTQRFTQFLQALHPDIISIEWSLLVNEAGCAQQNLHCADHQLAAVEPNQSAKPLSKPRISASQLSYSIIIALEDTANPTRLVVVQREKHSDYVKTVTIPQGGFVMLRGDCPHAGAAYMQHNTCAYVRLGTAAFPHDSVHKVSVYEVRKGLNTPTAAGAPAARAEAATNVGAAEVTEGPVLVDLELDEPTVEDVAVELQRMAEHCS